ncbi:MAG TPA: hypothetical protein IGR64_06405 [Leptolyngbyaceae cyanobacterium M65_K2018_010]|nr:hypothetical protein [Leptolyngbyaceae cyanobacterium M65_K2018_010]
MIAPACSLQSYPSRLGFTPRFKRPLARLGLLVTSLFALGYAFEAQASQNQPTGAASNPVTALVSQSRPTFPAPGQYLFGQVPQPDQIGQGYMVLDNTGDRIYGALYLPNSSFDCFQGQIQGNQLAMTIINSYSQEAYPYSIALVSDTAVASDRLSNGLAPLSLSGFYALETVTDNDLRMLEMCRAVVNSQP